MTTKTPSIHHAAWNTAFDRFTTLNQKLAQAQGPEAQALEQALSDQQDDLMDLPTPSLAAVRIKLQILWEADLHGIDQASEEKRLILEDLEDLSTEITELLG